VQGRANLPMKQRTNVQTIADRIGSGAGWRPVAGHVLFWSAVLVFFVLYFGREAESYGQSLLFVALLLPVAMATTYFLTGVLVPRYLLPGRYARFALYAVYTLVASVYLELVVLVGSFVFFAGYEISAVNPATLDVFGLVVGLYLVVFLAMAANLTVRWNRLRAAHAAAEQARLEAQLKLREAELGRLKAQMHPHFLFNTLNNLYGLTLEGSEAAPDVVLRIADLLDYMLYRCDRPFVPLAGEVEHLRTYLELERLRYDAQRVQVTCDLGGALPEACVAPLLLVPLVENSFKHGVSRAAGTAWVRIRLRAADGQLRFTVENSKPAGEPVRSPGHAAGIGLANVRQRLSLLYPGTHTLDVCEEAAQFAVRLHLPLRKCDDKMPDRR
jgi:sensor histidine kinase YesM